MSIRIQKNQDKTYHLIFQDYKVELVNLGIPIQDIGELILMNWFDKHLYRVEHNDFVKKSMLLSGKVKHG